MNPAILGALIGAIPGTIAAALATWSATRSTRMTVTADHARWLREKRADTYVDLLRFLREAEVRRSYAGDSQKVTEELSRAMQDGLKTHATPEMYELTARAYAYTSSKAATAFANALNGDLKVWRLVQDSIEKETIKIDGELPQALKNASEASKDFTLKARIDLQ